MIQTTLAMSVLLLASLSCEGAIVGSSTEGVDVPPSLARQPAARTCRGLRSATYRMITPTFGGLPSDQSGRATLDAARLAFARPDGSTGTWEALGACRFTDPGADGSSTDYIVSQAGVLVGRVAVNGGASYRMAFGFPEQVHALSELAGTWNLIGIRAGNDAFYADAGSVSFDRAGATTAATECGDPGNWSLSTCTAVAADVATSRKPYLPDADGGFVGKSAGRMTRLFLYQAASGPLLLVGIGSDGAIFVGAPAALPARIPPVGETAMRWNLDITGRLASNTGIYTTIQTIVSVDAPRSSTRRKRTIGLADEHMETVVADDPRTGYVTRHRGEGLGTSGVPVRVNEVTTLQFLHLGLTSSILPGGKLFELSVLMP